MAVQERYVPQEQFSPHSSSIEGSDAFRLEQAHTLDNQSLLNNIVSYLGEYRFQVQEYTIEQTYYKDSDGVGRLHDIKGDAMFEIGRRAIEEKIMQGDATYKESADLLGMQQLDVLMASTKDGDTLLYASPVDPKAGFPYGFLYVGHVSSTSDEQKKLSLSSIRIDQASLPEYAQALSQISGQEVQYTTPNEFIVNPILVPHTIPTIDIYSVLKNVCHVEYKPQEAEEFQQLIVMLLPAINGFIQLVQTEVSADVKEKGLHTLENYALKTREEFTRVKNKKEITVFSREAHIYVDENIHFAQLMQRFSYEPPAVSGSCGSSSTKKSANMFGFGSIFAGADFGFDSLLENALATEGDYLNDPELCRCGGREAHFHCPGKNETCNKPIIVGKGITKCPSCGEGKKC